LNATCLEIRDLRVTFPLADGRDAAIVDGVDLAIRRGEALGMVGESGSGKTMIALSCLRLVPAPGRTEGTLRVNGHELLRLDETELCRLRGRDVGMVFQNPMTAFNPVRTIGHQLQAAWLRHHAGDTRAAARERAIAALRDVGIAAPERRVDAYPHEMSGGMLQRCLIALAIINGPSLIVADEPTTALDATVQAQILELLRARLADAGLLLVTHNLGVAADICDRIAVVYAGRVVELGPAAELLSGPRHPYTRALLEAAPRIDPARPPLVPIPGQPPGPAELTAGCRYAPRCPRALDRCAERPPHAGTARHAYACWNPEPAT
jgi:oligopeptide/dipeptide ABC transporter ATP-binding protein